MEKSICDNEAKLKFKSLGNDNKLNNGVTDDDRKEDGGGDDNSYYDGPTDEGESLDDLILECAEYERISKKYYYPYSVDGFLLVLNAYGEATGLRNIQNYGQY